MTFSRILKRAEQLLYRWGEEPIGVAVPFAAFLAVWLPPQMPDMFAGMETPIWQLRFSARPLLFGFSATLLGLSAWFWTRAALTARRGDSETDKARLRRKRARRQLLDDDEYAQLRHARHQRELEYVEWSEEWAPRMALLFAGGITVLPILFAVESGHFFSGLLGAELISFGLVGLLFAFVVYRTEFRWMNAFDAPDWMSNFRASRIIGDSPFGWPFAVLSLLCSLAALICVSLAPDFISQFDAPTTAIAALAFAVGPLVVALAIVRGLVERFIYLVRWVVNRAAPVQLMPGESQRVHRLANIAGTIVLGFWFLSPPWMLDKHVVRLTATEIDEPFGMQACPPARQSQNGGRSICRPDLKSAVTDWVEARRRVSGETGRVPIIIVAAEGGASRAAVWLIAAMRMLDNRTSGDFGRHVFAISGVSGGSLGAATYGRMVRARGREDGSLDWDDKDVRASLGHFATTDLLSATVATYFLNDMFGSMVGPLWTWAGVPDRNVALEHTFEKMWDENRGFAVPRHVPAGFLGLRFSPQSDSRTPTDLLPHMLLNGTDVGSGKRLITSTIRWAPQGSLFPDSGDFIRLASHDVRMATAVTNSARFPFISPAGRFVSAGPQGHTAYQIIDGGYFENYGARTVWELARAIEDLNAENPTLDVVPIVVVVSNDLDADQPPRAHGGVCRTMLEDVRANGSQVTIRCDDPQPVERCTIVQRAGATDGLQLQDQTIVPQSMAPIFGLAATRSAHGRDALNILRRDFCRAMSRPSPEATASTEDDPKVRMIHIALPKPDLSKGEAAPMNWVLNPAACDYMLNKAPWLAFNLRQADRLKATIDAVKGVALRTSQQDRPPPIDCSGR